MFSQPLRRQIVRHALRWSPSPALHQASNTLDSYAKQSGGLPPPSTGLVPPETGSFALRYFGGRYFSEKLQVPKLPTELQAFFSSAASLPQWKQLLSLVPVDAPYAPDLTGAISSLRDAASRGVNDLQAVEKRLQHLEQVAALFERAGTKGYPRGFLAQTLMGHSAALLGGAWLQEESSARGALVVRLLTLGDGLKADIRSHLRFQPLRYLPAPTKHRALGALALEDACRLAARLGDDAVGGLPIRVILRSENYHLLTQLVGSMQRDGVAGAPYYVPEQRLWTGLTALLNCDIDLQPQGAFMTALAHALPALMRHPQVDQRGPLLVGLTRPYRPVGAMTSVNTYGPSIERLGQMLKQAGAKGEAEFILRLAMTLRGVPENIQLGARLQRFIKHRKVTHDGKKLLKYVGLIVATQDPAALKAVLQHPTPEVLDGRLQARQHKLAGASAKALLRREDLLTGEGHKQEINKLYNDEILPELTTYLTLVAALPQACLRDGQLIALPELEHKVAQEILGRQATPEVSRKFATILNTWRAPHLLFAYATNLKKYRAFVPNNPPHEALATILRHVCDGTYPSWRRRNSEQLRVLLAAQETFVATDTFPKKFDLDAWERGAQVPLSAFCELALDGWTVADTSEANDIINSASEGAGSCQSVYDSTQNNHCLLGRMADVTKRMLVIRDATGAIAARAMFRVMLGVNDKRPYVFLSQVYMTAALQDHAEEVLAAFARRRAEAVGAQAVRLDNMLPGMDKVVPWTVRSEPSAQPDYWDEGVPHAFGGVSADAQHFVVCAL